MTNPRGLRALFALTIFLGAFLLFQLQPMMGRILLPWFGGASAVWTTCLLFFQAVLLVGYIYAHTVAVRCRPGAQSAIHIALLLASLLALLFASPERIWNGLESQPPVAQVLLILGLTIGLPYMVLASTSPLCQYWHHSVFPHGGAYRLYAVSNAGSLLGLLSYPLVVERLLPVAGQRKLWLILFCLFSLLNLCCLAWVIKSAGNRRDGQETTPQRSAAPDARDVVWWLIFAALGSGTLLAITNQMTHEIAVVPFLWVLPLSLYLITFIICFHRESWYDRRWSVILMIFSVPLATHLLLEGSELLIHWQILGYLVVLFAICMCCHGEMVRLKPLPDHLTFFYICVAGGGALGGAFVGIVAPVFFSGYWEYHLLIFISCCAVFTRWIITRDKSGWFRHRVVVWGPLALFLTLLFTLLVVLTVLKTIHRVDMRRNFYGAVAVYDRPSPKGIVRILNHGRIIHGSQIQTPERQYDPISYYGPRSGAALALRYHPKLARRDENGSFRVGIIGLGIGTVSAFAEDGDLHDYFEINPEVVSLAQEYFTYLDDSPAKIRIFVGDGRVELARRRASEPGHRYDVLIVDAFSSDAIPAHFLTRECFALYDRCLAADGVLVLNISNRFLSLDPVVRGLAEEAGFNVICLAQDSVKDEELYASTWSIVTRNESFLQRPEVLEARADCPAAELDPIVWTDNFISLWHVMRRK